MEPRQVADQLRLRRVLSEHGQRFTRQRAMIYDFLCGTTAHPTADEVLAWIRQHTRPPATRSAVDKTLAVLVECGLVQRLCNGFAPIRFDANVADHPHMTDEERGVLMDLPIEMAGLLGLQLSPEALADIRQRTGFQVTGLRLELVGRLDRLAPPGGAAGTADGNVREEEAFQLSAISFQPERITIASLAEN